MNDIINEDHALLYFTQTQIDLVYARRCQEKFAQYKSSTISQENIQNQYHMPQQQQKYFNEIIQNLQNTDMYIIEKTIKLYQHIAVRLWNQALTCKLILQKQFQHRIAQSIPDLYIDNDHILMLTSFFIDEGLSYQILQSYGNALELIQQSVQIGHIYLNCQSSNQQQNIYLKDQVLSVHKAFYTNVIWRYGPCNYEKSQNNTITYRQANNMYNSRKDQSVYFCSHDSFYNAQQHQYTQRERQIEHAFKLYDGFAMSQNSLHQIISFEKYIGWQTQYLSLSVVNVWSSIKQFLDIIYVDYTFIKTLSTDLNKVQTFIQKIINNTEQQQSVNLNGKINMASIVNQDDYEVTSFIAMSALNVIDLVQNIIDSNKHYDDMLPIITKAHDVLQIMDQLDSKAKKQIFQICVNYYYMSLGETNDKLNLILLAISCMLKESQIEPIIQIIMNSELYSGVLKYMLLYQRTSTIKIILLYYLFRLAITDNYFNNQLEMILNNGQEYFLAYKKRLQQYVKLKSDSKAYTRVIAMFCIIYIDFITNNISDETYLVKYKMEYEYNKMNDYLEDQNFIKQTIHYLLKQVSQ